MIGQIASDPEATQCEDTITPEVQVAVASGTTPYRVPAGRGEITSWSHNARSGAGQRLKLKVFRRVDGRPRFDVVGETSFRVLTPSAINSFPASRPVAVRGGDLLGSVTGGTGPVSCSFSTGLDADLFYVQPGGGDPRVGSQYDFSNVSSDPAAGMRLNISAVVGPDRTAPVISHASADPHAFGAASSAMAAAARKGTTFRYTLSEEASTKFTIARRRTGKKGFKRIGAFKRHGKAGRNAKHFSGKVGSRTLAPGKYRATLVASDFAGHVSQAVKVSFVVNGP